MARNKGFERLVKIGKGKNTARIRMIKERHQSSLRLSPTQVCKTEQSFTGLVQSSNETSTYSVTLLNKVCPQNCAMLCPDCNICVHMYMCNCADALIRTTICKHMHLVARMSSSISKSTTYVQETLDDGNNETTLLESLQEKTRLCDI